MCNKLRILIPLGGIGERFKKNGYVKPKALINVMGKPILCWLLDNLIKYNEDIEIWIPYLGEEYDKYQFKNEIENKYRTIQFVFFALERHTSGAAETILIMLNHIEKLNKCDSPVLCMDGDNFYNCDIIGKWNKNNMIFSFEDKGKDNIYSYIGIEDKKVKQIIEKEKISNFACTGCYGFYSWQELKKYISIMLLDDKYKQKGEFYLSCAISLMIKNNKEFNYTIINTDDYICLGTPKQVRMFINNNNFMNKKRICFDLDGTLVTRPKENGNYETVEPIQKNIDYLNFLRKTGNTIIIYTARRMKTHNGDQGKVIKDIGKITLETLDKFGIYYDEIYFGKPYADFYVDDLAVNAYDDIEKLLGYHDNKIVTRAFNKLENVQFDVYRKTSTNLTKLNAEIYYYKNIHKDIIDIFPKFYNYDENGNWYDIEKINGVTVSELYVSEILTEKDLITVIKTMNRIHNINIINNEKIDIYSNYGKKMNERIKMYKNTEMNNYNEKIDEVRKYLELYEKNNYGKFGIIHGDYVMTNILIENKTMNIKLIDMRGIIGNKETIYGDIMYDWAKLYQSLIGYDEILVDKKVSQTYRKNMINVFNYYFDECIGENMRPYLRCIAISLIISLIPLHDDTNVHKFWSLLDMC